MKIITSINIYNSHLFISYLDGGIDIVKFDNIHTRFHRQTPKEQLYIENIENNNYLTDISFYNNNLVGIENSKILNINLLDDKTNRDYISSEKEIYQLSLNEESKRLEVLTTDNSIDSISFGTSSINKARIINRNLKTKKKHSVSNMKSFKNNVFLAIRGYGASSLSPNGERVYRTEDAQDVDFLEKNQIIAVADGFEGIVLFEPSDTKPLKKIKIPEDICHEIKLFQRKFIIKGKNGIYTYCLNDNKLERIWTGSIGAFTTYYDMIFFSSKNKIHMLSPYSESIKHFKLLKDSIEITINKQIR